MDRSAGANVGSWLRDRAHEQPERPALRFDPSERSLSYGELNALANRCAQRLIERGVGRGERVALALESGPLVLALYFAAAKIGAILLPLNTRLTAPELEVQIRDADPRLLIGAASVALPELPTVPIVRDGAWDDELPPDPGEPPLAPGGESPQVLLYTSGTTGTPKGALLPHRKTVCNTLNAESYFGLGPQDVVVVPVPLFHSYGLLILSVPALFAGATVALPGRFDPVGLQECVRRHAGTILGAVPVMYRRMVRAGLRPDALASLRFAFTAGAPIDVATVRELDAAGVALRQGYGQTETSILCCLDTEHALEKAGSVGRPVGHCELMVADAAGKSVPPGEAGEILVRGGVVMLGYWRKPHETEAGRLRGWHRTGDLAVMDDEGFLTLVGRRKEMYISGGENVYPAEVERVLLQHPDVAEVAVIGVPDPEWGETGRAFVVPNRRPFDTEELLGFCRDRLAGFKRPRQVELVDELPHTPSGKVQKHLLGS